MDMRRRWIWGFAVAGLLSILVQLMSVSAWTAFVDSIGRMDAGDRDEAFFDDTVNSYGRLERPSEWTSKPSSGQDKIMSESDRAACLEMYRLAFFPLSPLKRFVVIPPAGTPCRDYAHVISLRLTWRGWKISGMWAFNEDRDPRRRADPEFFTAAWLIPQWRGPRP